MTRAVEPLTPPDAAPTSLPASVIISPEFVAAGHAIFTVTNGKGQHYTYRVVKAESSSKHPRPAWWVGFLTGPDNEHDYTYVGRYFAETGRFTLTNGSNLPAESLPVRVFIWAIAVIHGQKRLPDGYSIRHEGMCGRCGRRLTNPESIETGIGPECSRLLKAFCRQNP